MKHPFRYALCGALLCAFAAFSPSLGHASTGINQKIADAMDKDYVAAMKDVWKDLDELSRKVGDPNDWNPTDKRQAYLKKNMGLAINQKPDDDAKQHNDEVKQKEKEAYDSFDPSIGTTGGFRVENNMSGPAMSENATGENASCKIASLSTEHPAQKTTILASPIAATLLALPIQAPSGGGSGPCPQPPKRDKCKDGQWTKPAQGGETANALPQSPVNDTIQKLNGDKHIPQ